MAVSKNQLQQTLDMSENIIFNQAENYIDRELKVKYAGKGTSVVVWLNDLSSDIGSGIPQQVIASLILLYEKQGWTVELHKDETVGFWLEFS